MALFIDSLVKSACKLLHRMDQNLLSLPIHLETFYQGTGFSLDHSLASQYHVRHYFVLEHINLTSSLIILLENIIIRFFSLFNHQVLHSFDFISSHRFQLLPLQTVLSRRHLPLAFNFIDLGHDFPAESFSEFRHKRLQMHTFRR